MKQSEFRQSLRRTDVRWPIIEHGRLVGTKLRRPLAWAGSWSVWVLDDLFDPELEVDEISMVVAMMAVTGAVIQGWEESPYGGKYGGRWDAKRLRWVDRQGPHRYFVGTAHPERALELFKRRPSFRESVATHAYRFAEDQRDAGYLHDALSARPCDGDGSPAGTEGKAWPPSNITIQGVEL